jgi:hypothetical protein
VVGRQSTAVCIGACIGLAACLGCDSRTKPAASSQPAGTAKVVLTLIVPESANWSQADAAAHLAEPKLGVSAAVRLVRLADVTPLCVPVELTDEQFCRLRLMPLGAERWALGLADRKDERRLHAPVLISAVGDVTLLASGTDEEALVLHVSKDAEVFPHVAVLPDRVLLVDETVTPAIVLASAQEARFELREQRGFSYVALVLSGPGRAKEVTRYRWDPYELSFIGPGTDRLPDPPGGKFQMDLKASRRLVPEGGQVPETRPNKEPPPRPNEEWQAA